MDDAMALFLRRFDELQRSLDSRRLRHAARSEIRRASPHRKRALLAALNILKEIETAIDRLHRINAAYEKADTRAQIRDRVIGSDDMSEIDVSNEQ